MAAHRIAVIPGDGIGGEVTEAGLAMLEALAAATPDLELEFESFPWGSDFYRATGAMMPADALARLAGFDAIYFVAVGDVAVPDHVTLWGLRLAICQGFDQYANVRPARLLPGIASPLRDVAADDLDWVIVRENSEGEYTGAGGRAHAGFAGEVGVETAVFTRAGIERIMRFAFVLARKRPRRRLTLVTKSNAQRHGMVLWDEVFAGLAADYADVETDRVLVDAATVRMVRDPASIDVMVATNLHGRHPERSRRRAGRRARAGAERQPQSRARLPVDVRAGPRLRCRHRRQGRRQPDRRACQRGDDARPPGRKRRRRAAHGGDRARHRGRRPADPRPRRHGDDRGPGGRGLPRHFRGRRLTRA